MTTSGHYSHSRQTQAASVLAESKENTTQRDRGNWSGIYLAELAELIQIKNLSLSPRCSVPKCCLCTSPPKTRPDHLHQYFYVGKEGWGCDLKGTIFSGLAERGADYIGETVRDNSLL